MKIKIRKSGIYRKLRPKIRTNKLRPKRVPNFKKAEEESQSEISISDKLNNQPKLDQNSAVKISFPARKPKTPGEDMRWYHEEAALKDLGRANR